MECPHLPHARTRDRIAKNVTESRNTWFHRRGKGRHATRGVPTVDLSPWGCSPAGAPPPCSSRSSDSRGSAPDIWWVCSLGSRCLWHSRRKTWWHRGPSHATSSALRVSRKMTAAQHAWMMTFGGALRQTEVSVQAEHLYSRRMTRPMTTR